MNNRFESFTAAIFEISRCWHKLVAKEMNKLKMEGNGFVAINLASEVLMLSICSPSQGTLKG